MSYEVLARKWRPANFDTLVGQEHVQRALVNALDEDRLHHAYLFTGTRGVGKTTIARIFAKALNCETGVTSTPCGECASCRELAEGRFVDLIEVDAASRTKVDETRELLENVQYAPTRGRYKVYLIDEVHMFSNHSFNALLKTLEEPPPHVKFLLATTDPQKLPVTILSRCLQFNLKRIAVSDIIAYLQSILDSESIQYELTALQLLAEAADGSMRDALSLLDQALAFGAGSLNDVEVREMLGSVARDKVLRILKALLDRDINAVLSTLAELSEMSPDYDKVLAELLSMLHHMALAQQVPEALDDYVSARESLLELCHQVSAEDLQLFYQIALIGRRDLSLSPDPRSGLEMVLMRMMTFRPAAGGAVAPTAGNVAGGQAAVAAKPGASQLAAPRQAQSTLSQTSQKIAQPASTDYSASGTPVAASNATTVSAASPAAPVVAQQVADTEAPPAAAPVAQARMSLAETLPEHWRVILENISISGMVKQLAANCVLQSVSGSTINLVIDQGYRQLLNVKAEQRLKQALCEYYDQDLHLDIIVAGNAGEVPVPMETPAKTLAREKDERQQQAETSIANDGFVQSMQKNFNAEIVPGSIKPVSES